jgi:hypothetical protein
MNLPPRAVTDAVRAAAAVAGIHPVLIYSPTRGPRKVSDARREAIKLAFRAGATRAAIARALGRDWASVNQALGKK